MAPQEHIGEDNSEVTGTEDATEQAKKHALTPEMEERKWKPGQSGNPGGRPKKKWLTEAFEEMLERKLGDKEFREQFIESHWAKLIGKTVVSSMLLEKVLDRTEGKLTQPVDVSGEIDIVTIIEEGRKRLG